MFERVLVGVDGRSGGEDAIALARHLVPASGRLMLANVYGDGGWVGRGGGRVISDERVEARRMLTRARETSSVVAETLVAYDGATGRALHTLAEEKEADLH